MQQNRKPALVQFHREGIIDAAMRLFTERGLDETTMGDIAQEAGYSKSTMYVYFSSKDEISSAVAARLMTQMRQDLVKAVDPGLSFLEQYKVYSQYLIDLRDNEPYQFQVLTGALRFEGALEGEAPWLHDALSSAQDMFVVLQAFYQQGVDAGVLREEAGEGRSAMLMFCAMSGLVSMVSESQFFLEFHLGASRQEFLEYGLRMLLRMYEK